MLYSVSKWKALGLRKRARSHECPLTLTDVGSHSFPTQPWLERREGKKTRRGRKGRRGEWKRGHREGGERWDGGQEKPKRKGTNLHQSPGLADDCVLQAVQDEAIDLLQDSHRGLPDLPHQGIGSVHCGWSRLWVRD